MWPSVGGRQQPSPPKSAQIGFWAALWCPRATHKPRRPFLSRPVRAGWTPFGSVGALWRDAISYTFRWQGFEDDCPAQSTPQGEWKTAFTPATAPSPSNLCVTRLRLILCRLAGSGSRFFCALSTTFDGFNGTFVPLSMGLQTYGLRSVSEVLPIFVFGGPPLARRRKKMLCSHGCRVKFRRVCEFVGVFLPSLNPS